MKQLQLVCRLECGHDVLWLQSFGMGMPHLMFCETCSARVAVWAVECRQWHSVCRNCRWGRWTGASDDLAMEKGARHEVSKPEHEVVVRYQLEPSVFQWVREQLGKRMRVKLDETPDLRVVMKYLNEDSDIPPF